MPTLSQNEHDNQARAVWHKCWSRTLAIRAGHTGLRRRLRIYRRLRVQAPPCASVGSPPNGRVHRCRYVRLPLGPSASFWRVFRCRSRATGRSREWRVEGYLPPNQGALQVRLRGLAGHRTDEGQPPPGLRLLWSTRDGRTARLPGRHPRRVICALIVSCSGLPAVVGVEHAPSHPGRAADPCQRDRRDGYVEVLATT